MKFLLIAFAGTLLMMSCIVQQKKTFKNFFKIDGEKGEKKNEKVIYITELLEDSITLTLENEVLLFTLDKSIDKEVRLDIEKFGSGLFSLEIIGKNQIVIKDTFDLEFNCFSFLLRQEFVPVEKRNSQRKDVREDSLAPPLPPEPDLVRTNGMVETIRLYSTKDCVQGISY